MGCLCIQHTHIGTLQAYASILFTTCKPLRLGPWDLDPTGTGVQLLDLWALAWMLGRVLAMHAATG
mgnify:FL=1